MHRVQKVMERRKRAMSISQIANAADVSYSHAKNAVTSYRDMYWVPLGKHIVREKKGGVNKYRLTDW